MIIRQPKTASDYVLGGLGNGLVVGKGICADTHQRLSSRDRQLDRDHPRGLIDLGPVYDSTIKAERESTRRGVVLETEHRFGQDFDKRERVVVLGRGQLAFNLLIQGEHTDISARSGQRIREHGPDPRLASERHK